MSSVSVFVLLVFLCTVPVCCPIKVLHRIVGGKIVRQGESPYQVSLQYIATWKHFGAGSIIDDRHVITAAHCVHKMSVSAIGVAAGLVRLSDPAQRRYLIDKMYIHKYFKPKLMNDDIAILKIAGKFQFEKSKLDAIPLRKYPIPPGSPVSAYGWGMTSTIPERVPDNLQVVDLITLNFIDCVVLYNNSRFTYVKLSKGMICAGVLSGAHFACNGDGGGALVNYDKKLVGITSWGTDGCGSPDLPGIFTDVTFYRQWIRDTLKYSRNSSRSTFARLFITHRFLLILYFLLLVQ